MKGVIDKIWENKTKEGKKYWVLNIDGEKYSVWDKKYMEGIQEGSAVEYEWAASGDFRKVTGIKKIEIDPDFNPGERNAKNHQIIRMSCLKSATALVSNIDGKPDEKGEITLGIARRFEKYVAEGDDEKKSATKNEE